MTDIAAARERMRDCRATPPLIGSLSFGPYFQF
jgi:hypothetical protein